MKTLSVHEAKTRLSAILADIEATGESFLVCRRGKPVAELVPHAKPHRLKPHPVMGKIKIKYDPAALVHYSMWVNGVQAAFNPIPLITPVGTTNLGYVVYAITTTASAKNLAISDLFIEFD